MTEILTTLPEKLDPAHTAIIVIDMQNDFCADGGYLHENLKVDMSGNGPLSGRIMELVAAARDTGAMVVWIKANYEPRYLSGQALAKLREKGINSICCEGGTWGWDLYGVSAEPDEWVIEKHTYSGFHGTELDRVLRFRGIRTLVMTGVATNVCVESTLRDGYFNGYYIVMPEDCVDSAARDLHDATIKNVRMHFGEVVDTGAEIAALWSGKTDAGLRQAG
ncbi:MAG: isochorismatase family protein [Rhodospirillales bacterium]|nr:isochorismatase family protein [Rhodospirillales bacterium]